MIQKVLVANRGEIAVRIIRACQEMGIETVAIYSTADKEALHVKLADEAVCIGRPLPKESYLHIENIISAAVLTGADAIHPGFGFLSENTKFAEICAGCGIKFIGPTAEMISLMGDKARAREKMIASGVPVVPGSEGKLTDSKEAVYLADQIGYPVILKASAGGGGRGMRIVWKEEDLEKAFLAASSEAANAFGDGSMYLEKYIVKPRHIEFQILGDSYGHVVHLGERDCSMQRRHQKVLEEAPSAFLSESLREEMGRVAVMAAQAVHYENAGTIEFIVDAKGHYYFIEMNTRIQVEHPVTEMITGVDLIKEQIRIASGEALSFRQEDIRFKGHALECRINAENPHKQFRPCAGTIEKLHLPGGRGVRVETALYEGYQIPPTYDSMLAKIITYGETREEAIAIMERALGEIVIDGIDTNLYFEYQLLGTEAFRTGNFDTGYIEANLAAILEEGVGSV
ncbi:acetyl-CoA carboxylase biotin carboxylase subunit [Sporanaerobium hydrogeniformans]|uniref:Acetyl-CoA carboxylase biotin carboxylase subunit n=1 Tax=Sporanaerobium hydrogeniformans TaxID=3072179 RepID=A0AC61DCW0_9FIRM|nr:acetyl-CoA carboxylase biotin carboxylase subunit [Sporanaerobium hydrogeniformans]PHV70412.1 acetyl-CoA carboxylase biotin carboxylase subunit [Sporanaerobium hydrogeniformans]